MGERTLEFVPFHSAEEKSESYSSWKTRMQTNSSLYWEKAPMLCTNAVAISGEAKKLS